MDMLDLEMVINDEKKTASDSKAKEKKPGSTCELLG